MKCERGYLCQICGAEVEEITESELYLRYVCGLVDPEQLHTLPERHLRCNPVLAQFVVDERFPVVAIEGDFDKRRLDPEHVRQRESLLTRGWQRLHEVLEMEEISVADYPLPEVRENMRQRFG